MTSLAVEPNLDHLGALSQLTDDEIEQVDGGVAHVGLSMAVGAVSGGLASYASGGSWGQVAGGALVGAVGGLWGATGGAIQIFNAGALAFGSGIAFGGGGSSNRFSVMMK